MKKSSVFVLLLASLSFSCNPDTEWTMNGLSGTYFLAAEEKNVMERLFESDNVSGWNYDEPFVAHLQLNADGTYEESFEGSCFETPSCSGTWHISSDSLFLNTLAIDCPECVIVEVNTPVHLPQDTLLIRSERELEVVVLSGTDKGRILLRK